jgi:hypothetical protein
MIFVLMKEHSVLDVVSLLPKLMEYFHHQLKVK